MTTMRTKSVEERRCQRRAWNAAVQSWRNAGEPKANSGADYDDAARVWFTAVVYDTDFVYLQSPSTVAWGM